MRGICRKTRPREDPETPRRTYTSRSTSHRSLCVLQPRYMHHPNRAKMLTECIVCTTDPSGYAAKDERYSGHESEQRGNLSIVDLGYSRVVVVAPEHLDPRCPELRTAHTFFPDLFACHTKQYFSRSHKAMRSLKLAQCLPHLLQHLLLFKVSEHTKSYPAC